jgi:hypothetical protein
VAGALIEIDELVSAVESVLRAGASLTLASVTVTPRQSASAKELYAQKSSEK